MLGTLLHRELGMPSVSRYRLKTPGKLTTTAKPCQLAFGLFHERSNNPRLQRFTKKEKAIGIFPPGGRGRQAVYISPMQIRNKNKIEGLRRVKHAAVARKRMLRQKNDQMTSDQTYEKGGKA